LEPESGSLSGGISGIGKATSLAFAEAGETEFLKLSCGTMFIRMGAVVILLPDPIISVSWIRILTFLSVAYKIVGD
jgi:hypothetical protein